MGCMPLSVNEFDVMPDWVFLFFAAALGWFILTQDGRIKPKWLQWAGYCAIILSGLIYWHVCCLLSP